MKDNPPTCSSCGRSASKGRWSPAFWHLEIANVVLMTERRKRIDRAERLRVMSELANLPLEIDDRTSDLAWTETMILAERHDLTVYDASYLELCIRSRLPLATRDKALVRAMSTLGLTIC